MALELSIRVKKLVAKLAKSFGIHTRHTESLGDFRYNSSAPAAHENSKTSAVYRAIRTAG